MSSSRYVSVHDWMWQKMMATDARPHIAPNIDDWLRQRMATAVDPSPKACRDALADLQCINDNLRIVVDNQQRKIRSQSLDMAAQRLEMEKKEVSDALSKRCEVLEHETKYLASAAQEMEIEIAHNHNMHDLSESRLHAEIQRAKALESTVKELEEEKAMWNAAIDSQERCFQAALAHCKLKTDQQSKQIHVLMRKVIDTHK